MRLRFAGVETMRQKFDELERVVRECGSYAKERQGCIHRSYKPDGTVLTETDLEVTRRIVRTLLELFPDCNIVTEEEVVREFDENAPLTFVLDPIDGTDSYSQGFPAWCVGLGVLDRNRQPVGSFVYGPRFGRGCEELFLRTDPDDPAVYINGEPLSVDGIRRGEKDVPRYITTGSNILKQLPLEKAGCRFRSYGCSILHIVSAVAFFGIDACIDPLCYAWDIVPPHAIARKVGMEYQYWTEEEFFYDDSILLDRKMFSKPLVIGTGACRKELIARLNG